MNAPSRRLDQRLAQVFQGAGGRVSGLTRSLPERFESVATEASARRWAWTGVALGGLAALVVWAPAAWLASGVQGLTQGRVQLADARGTIWNGDAVAVLTGGADSHDARSLPGRLEWRLRPRWTGARLSLRQDCCLREGVDLDATAGLARLRVDVRPRASTTRPDGSWAQWPADWLAGLGTPWNTMELGGALRLSSRELALQWVQGRFSIQGQTDLTVQDLSSRLSTLPRLGNYRIRIVGDPQEAGTARVALDTLDGALRLTGQGNWGGGGLRLRGEATAQDADQGALTNLLNLLGRREGNRTILSIG